jgi:hypothetical protein
VRAIKLGFKNTRFELRWGPKHVRLDLARGRAMNPASAGHRSLRNEAATVPDRGGLWRSSDRRGHSRMTVESQDRTLAVIGIAFVIAVEEPRADFSQIARSDVFTAPRTKGLPARRPAVHQKVSHVAPPRVKQNTVSEGLTTLGGGAQR